MKNNAGKGMWFEMRPTVWSHCRQRLQTPAIAVEPL